MYCQFQSEIINIVVRSRCLTGKTCDIWIIKVCYSVTTKETTFQTYDKYLFFVRYKKHSSFNERFKNNIFLSYEARLLANKYLFYSYSLTYWTPYFDQIKYSCIFLLLQAYVIMGLGKRVKMSQRFNKIKSYRTEYLISLYFNQNLVWPMNVIDMTWDKGCKDFRESIRVTRPPCCGRLGN